jgi:hypothetical protein
VKKAVPFLLLLFAFNFSFAQAKELNRIDSIVAGIDLEHSLQLEYEELLLHEVITREMVPGVGPQTHTYQFFYKELETTAENEIAPPEKVLVRVWHHYDVAASLEIAELIYYVDAELISTVRYTTGMECEKATHYFLSEKLAGFKIEAVEDCEGENSEAMHKTSGFSDKEQKAANDKQDFAKKMQELFKKVCSLN